MMYTRRIRVLAFFVAVAGIGLTAHSATVHAGMVALQGATATFSQLGRDVQHILDPNPNLGWALSPSQGVDQTAVVETVMNLGFAPGTALTFTMEHVSPFGNHNLGRFRLSVTTDNRSLFADGLQSGGDVTANWIVLDPLTFTSSGGATMTKLGDMSLFLSGINPDNDTYTVTAETALTGITGFRLEALSDAGLPGNGPGRAGNANFILTKFVVDAVAVPEPSTFVLAGLALMGLVGFGVRKRK